MGQALKEHGITSAEYPVLIYLIQKNGVTQEELVEHLYLDKSAITRVIQTLSQKEYIQKSKDEKDLRCNRIYLTKKGISVHQHIEKALEEWNTIIMEDIGLEKQEEIYELLMHMVENVKEEFLDR